MAFTFLRPAVYLSTATLSVSRRTTSSEQNPAYDTSQQDISILAVQRHLASNPSVIADVFERFAEQFESGNFERADGSVPDFAEVTKMLSAYAVPETNLLELRAEGGQPAELTYLVQTWIDVFLAGQANAERQTAQSTSQAIEKQRNELESRVAAKRDELAAFRETYDIASIQREENRTLARLNGLTKSLAAAEEAEATATARVEALEATLKAGLPIQPSEADQVLAEMETRAAEAHAWLREREAVATSTYLDQDKRVVKVKEFVELLDRAIQERHAKLGERELSNAQLEMAAAQKTVAKLRDELAKQEQVVAEFTTRFAEHEALVEDLRQLESLHRQLQERAVQTEVVREALPPELSVTQNATIPQRPIRPDYDRDALITLGVSLLAALFAVTVDWLETRPRRRPAPMQALETRTVYYPLLDSQVAVGHRMPVVGNLIESAAGSDPAPRQLPQSEAGRSVAPPGLLRQLDDAIQAQDADAARRLAHAMKDAARQLAAVGAEQAAADIEESAARNDLESASQQMLRLREAIDQLVRE